MRRLPIYFLIDVSESMVGEPIEQVQDGMAEIIKELRTDPYALETVFLSIIAFAGKAKNITPLIELYKFYPPKFPIGGGTSLGKGITMLMDDMDINVQKTTLEVKGDWKPIVFLFTDGAPTDNYDSAFNRWNTNYRNKANLIVVSIGANMDNSIFGKITDTVLSLNENDSDAFKKFFKWVTASIKTSSLSVSEQQNDGLQLAPIKDNYLSKIDLEKVANSNVIDDNYAVLLAKCQSKKQPYLIKYDKKFNFKGDVVYTDSKMYGYKLHGAYPVENDYFELSDGDATSKVNSAELTGFPCCPCCGNQYGIAFCSCGKIMCCGEESVSTCPWCGVTAEFGAGEGHFDISRTKG